LKSSIDISRKSEVVQLIQGKKRSQSTSIHSRETVKGLEARVEMLTTNNALMKEDLDISRTSLTRAREENQQLLAELEAPQRKQPSDETARKATKEEVSGKCSNMFAQLLVPPRRIFISREKKPFC